MLHTRTIIMSTHANPFEVKSMEEQIGDNGEILSVNTLGKKCFNAPKIFHLMIPTLFRNFSKTYETSSEY